MGGELKLKHNPDTVAAGWQQHSKSSWLVRVGGGLLGVKWSQSWTEKQHYTPH